MRIRQASYALRVVRRRTGNAAILYRRRLTSKGRELFDRVGAISPLAFSSGTGLLHAAVKAGSGSNTKLTTGPFLPLDPDWGARIACYTLVAKGLRNAHRMHLAAENIRHSDSTEAAWWFGLMTNSKGKRAVRALRIFVEAVK